MPKRTMDDVMNEAEAVHARNKEKLKKEKKKSTKRTTRKKQTAIKKKPETDFLPTTSEDEESVVAPRIAKKRRTDKYDHLIAKQMAESGQLFGVAVPASNKKIQKTPSPSASKNTKNTPHRKPAAKPNSPKRSSLPAARPAVARPPAVASANNNIMSHRRRPAPVPRVAPAPRREIPRIYDEQVISRRNEAMIQDITDDEVSEMPEELAHENPIETSADEEETNGTSLASKLSFSCVFIVSFVIALVSVLLAVPPVVSFIETLDPKVVVHSTSSFVSGGLVHVLKTTVFSVWSLLMKGGGLWWASLTVHPLKTIGLSVFSYFLIATFYRYRQRKCRLQMTRELVVATRNMVYKELYVSSRPVSPDIIFARIAFNEFPHSGSQRNAFKNDIWEHVVREIQGDPRVSVERMLRSGRTATEWSWVDPNPPAGI